MKISVDQKELLLLVLLGGNLFLWPQFRHFYFPSQIAGTAPYPVPAFSGQKEELGRYVSVNGLNIAHELCRDSGKVAWLEGLVPPEGDNNALVRCGNGVVHQFSSHAR